MPTTIVLFHQNLRLVDNRALAFAAERGIVVPVYIYEDAGALTHKPGGASRWWLQETLKDLGTNLKNLGAELVLRRGEALAVIRDLINQTGAGAVTWNRRYEPDLASHDEKLKIALQESGVNVQIHEGFLLFDPSSIRTGSGTPFKIFTPFSKACFSSPPPPQPITAPQTLQGIKGIGSDHLDDWNLVPRTAEWPKSLAKTWDISAKAAGNRLNDFINAALDHYKEDRDHPHIDGTSRLSPYLHFGQISPHQIWYAVQNAAAIGRKSSASVERYLLEILWREFSWHLLHQFPALPDRPLVNSFENFPWRDDPMALKAWQKGMTGYPLVDAGMRQLWQTGWMHNRVRMIVASFLIKHLLIHWRQGTAWFWDTLVDADLGSNSASWQWVAGCGADAAPFFRIFNPILQGKKFDQNGEYVKHFVPELAKLDAEYIHAPWLAPPDQLREAGIKLDSTYPLPIVDHDAARKRALEALARTKDPRHA